MTEHLVPTDTHVRVLLVDDDATNLSVLHHTLSPCGYQLLAAKNGDDALKIARQARPGLVLLDVVMPGIDGYETCRRLREDSQTRDATVIFLSALDETKDKVRGLELGAVDFITKPFQAEEVVARVRTHLTIRRLQQELEARNAQLSHELQVAQELLREARRRVDGPLLGDSPPIRALREAIAQHAKTTDTILLTGPHGSGHEATARAIHHESSRARSAFIHVNCALLQGSQHSDLFSARAATTIGQDAPLSTLELVADGTLYLEELQRLPQDLQLRLADILEAIDLERARGRPARPDIRVIAHSSIEPGAAGFHPQLLRLVGRRQVRVPSLAERVEDIPVLARYFVRQHARRLGAVVEDIADQSMKRLCASPWPDDVRELQNVLERAVVSARTRVLEIDKALLDEGLPLGHYRLVEKLGQGGMGEVWRAKHQLLARPAAVKLIRSEAFATGTHESAQQRFQLEARATASLNSPNTVKLYDFGVSEAGELYYVMELLNGMDLASLVHQFGALPPERVVHILLQACRSLAEAHEVGLLHRDIKAQNLFLCRLGLDFDVLKVLDFGLAKWVSNERTHLTTEGALMGTPATMPPECVHNGMGIVDERSDLYSLGCVGYWILTGSHVFQGDPIKVLMHHVQTSPDPPSKRTANRIPKSLEHVILRCLAKNPADRPGSALELWQQLSKVELTERWTPDRAEKWWRACLPHLSDRAAGSDEDSASLWRANPAG